MRRFDHLTCRLALLALLAASPAGGPAPALASGPQRATATAARSRVAPAEPRRQRDKRTSARVPRARTRAGAPAACRGLFCSSPEVLRLDGQAKNHRRLSSEEIDGTVSAHERDLQPCLVEARRADPLLTQTDVDVVVTSRGRVLATRADGRRSSALARCLHRALQRAQFPCSTPARTVASFTLQLPRSQFH